MAGCREDEKTYESLGETVRKREAEPGGELKSQLKVRAAHLNRILARERTRADRSGRPLSMVLLGYDGSARRRPDASVIVAVMQQRRG